MKILKWLDENLEEFLMVILLISMTLVMGIQVCARYLFNHSLVWSEEVARYMFIWATFVSISYCSKKGISIKIEQGLIHLSEKKRAYVQVFTNIIELAFFVYLIPYAFMYLQASIESGQLSPATGMPMYFLQIAPLVTFILVSIRVIQSTIKEIKIIRRG